jgi:hypothetical protein
MWSDSDEAGQHSNDTHSEDGRDRLIHVGKGSRAPFLLIPASRFLVYRCETAERARDVIAGWRVVESRLPEDPTTTRQELHRLSGSRTSKT